MSAALPPRVKGRDIYEVANQLEGYVDEGTPDRLADFLIREGEAANDLAEEIVRLMAANERLSAELARARELFDACAVARDDAGFVGTVPDCIEALDGEVKLATGRAETVETLLATSQRELAELRQAIAGKDRQMMATVTYGQYLEMAQTLHAALEGGRSRAEAAEARATASERQVEAMREVLAAIRETYSGATGRRLPIIEQIDEIATAALQKGNPDA